MWQDPIVAQIHQYREEYAREHHFDLHAMLASLKAREKSEKRAVIQLPIRRVNKPTKKPAIG